MQGDRLRERLDQGEVAYGVVTAWSDSNIVEAAGAAGFDFAFIDAEHGALGIQACAELVRAATCGGMTSLVRVPYGEIRGVYAYLDAGAQGLIFPHIKDVAGARAAVAACMFPPEGSRGAMSSSRAARYGRINSPREYYRAANDEVWVVPMIEDAEAVTGLEDILSVPGIRALFVGPGDLALSQLGLQNDGAQSVDALVDHAIATGVHMGKIVATVASTPVVAEALVKKGVRIIGVGATGLYMNACRSYLDAAPRSVRVRP